MKTKINIKLMFSAAIIMAVLFSSCLKEGLPKYPAFSGDLITNVYFEYRWQDNTQTYNGQPIVNYQRLNIDSQQIDTVKNVITVALSVPAASGSFTAVQKANVSQNHLWMYSDLSTVATASPGPGTPALGDVTDFTKPQTYIVKAANGNTRTWKVIVSSFTND